MSNDNGGKGDVPAATVVQDGKLGGDTPKTAAPAPRQPYKRKLSNFMLDKKLQLRYVLLVTVLSAMISGSLGYLIYHQRHAASASIDSDLAALTQSDSSFSDVKTQVAEDNAHDDRMLVYKMAGVGIGLVLILSAYLVIMTHKVAGPLFKVSMYFDRMAEGRIGSVYGLRKGDMLQDFFGNFKEMHESVRTRMQADVITMESAADALRGKLAASPALEAMDKHLAQRKKQLL
ncbi:MAG TPA: hypothetical protein VFQ65_16750 [Kofleriaceae bacterium]|nr:hypothetical protein [Kofleriaceae bacterium]